MKKEELRIGNFIEQGKVLEVKPYHVGVSYWHIHKQEDAMSLVKLYECEPIPLSEEVLLKCGAIIDGIEYIIKASALPINIRFHSGIAYCEFGNVYLGDRIKYLHELQNLKYIICGV